VTLALEIGDLERNSLRTRVEVIRLQTDEPLESGNRERRTATKLQQTFPFQQAGNVCRHYRTKIIDSRVHRDEAINFFVKVWEPFAVLLTSLVIGGSFLRNKLWIFFEVMFV
jgi:hypothetical protein